ncbi:MAG: UvrD-helicase domain-containing protein [Oscillospiraceae bacterium]|nr:UvrD-helicase domain-containing protein [Oscillospiraceae bacterium]
MTPQEFNDRFISARRTAIARDFSHLNERQRDAVLKTNGPLLILAGAGSGKTTVLINRIANLLRYGCASDSDSVPEWAGEEELEILEEYARTGAEELRNPARLMCAAEPAEPWRIVTITFTNKAAGELKTRLEDMLGPGARDIWAMTFHSACVRILRRDIDKLGYDRSFAIYDNADSIAILKRIINEQGYDDKDLAPKTVLNYISRAKDEGMSAAEYSADAERRIDVRRRIIAAVYTEYEKRMRASNALDFDDLILMTVRLLSENEQVREYYQNRFKYLLIDEYQDTNTLQYNFARLLCGKRCNICVVGDDDQSIYKFRGATIENILSFERHYPGAEVIRLEQNYRSTNAILSAANDVIGHNKTRHGKTLWTAREGGELPRLFVAEDERDEARFVAETIIDNVTGGKPWSANAVLYRMNAQSNSFEYEFKRNNIPYRVYGGTGFFERAEIKDLVAYFCAVNNPRDEAHLLRIINTPARGIGNTTIELVTRLAAERGIALYDLIRDCALYPELSKAEGKLSAFVRMIEYLSETARTLGLDDFYDTLIEASGLVRALEAKKTDENLTRIENIREFRTNVVNFASDTPDGTLADFLGEIALYTDLDRQDEGADCVAMMTIHSAKGLEFDTVFIVGAEDGIFPGLRAIGEQEEMEEERRLCYVAMTRAKRRLFFVKARRRMLFGRTEAHDVSRFIREIGEGNVDLPEDKPRFDAFSDSQWFSDDSTRGFAREKPAGRSHYAALRREEPKRSGLSAAPAVKSAFTAGQRVLHKAFGAGVIVSAKPTGGDTLLEVEFETAGTKRLMGNSAANYMTAAE